MTQPSGKTDLRGKLSFFGTRKRDSREELPGRSCCWWLGAFRSDRLTPQTERLQVLRGHMEGTQALRLDGSRIWRINSSGWLGFMSPRCPKTSLVTHWLASATMRGGAERGRSLGHRTSWLRSAVLRQGSCEIRHKGTGPGVAFELGLDGAQLLLSTCPHTNPFPIPGPRSCLLLMLLKGASWGVQSAFFVSLC